MSAFANFFVISKANFEEYRKMASLISKAELERKRALNNSQQSEMIVRLVGPEEMRSPEFQKRQAYYKKLWNFLHTKGKEPYEYKWSGYTLVDVLDWLKKVKGINLMRNEFADADDGELVWWVFDEKIKNEYAEQLNPSNFKEADVVNSYEHIQAQEREAAMKEMALKLNKEQMAQFQHYNSWAGQHGEVDKEEHDARAKGMIAGIIILHKYMQLIGGELIVVLNVG